MLQEPQSGTGGCRESFWSSVYLGRQKLDSDVGGADTGRVVESQESGRESGRQASQAAFFWTFLIYMCHLPHSRKCQSSILQEHLLPFVSSSWEHAHKHTYPKARILVHSRSIELTLKVNRHSSFTLSKQFHVLKVLCAVY